ncbi:unnamed protein product [Ilex paraguariensis]|uniref:Receptor ligand binding region domain-containing protein n=1 Tax=Ilex paraguariensis TaxID=185542 RepID=A0ABC8SB57_9AQUA
MDIRKMNLTLLLLTPFIIMSHLHAQSNPSHNNGLIVAKEIPVGLILDLGSWVGKTVHSCITMAISDFYAQNSHYKKRIVLHTRDSQGEPLHALSAALDLLQNNKVQAIVGLETPMEAKFLAPLGDKAKVPILSFTTIPSSSIKYPYLIQITEDETTHFKGVATIVESFKWRGVIFINEDTDHGREILPYLIESFLEKNLHIAHRTAISPSANDHQILQELHKHRSMQAAIFIVHMSPSLASRLFLNVKRLGMMSGGYAWIITETTMNLLHSADSEVIKSLQGVLGFKSYIPSSRELHNFTRRWKHELYTKDPTMEVNDLNVFGIWAYDGIWALAKAVERVGTESPPVTNNQGTGLRLFDLAEISVSQSGRTLLNEILQTKFRGLSGEFQIMNGKLKSQEFEIVNVIGKGERTVGFWTSTDGIKREMYRSVHGLETIIWPGGSTIIPKGWMMSMSGKKLRVGVPTNPGFKELVHVDQNQANETTVTGFCIAVFKAAIEALPFEVPYEFIPFVGADGKNLGTYNDLTDQVYLQVCLVPS